MIFKTLVHFPDPEIETHTSSFQLAHPKNGSAIPADRATCLLSTCNQIVKDHRGLGVYGMDFDSKSGCLGRPLDVGTDSVYMILP